MKMGEEEKDKQPTRFLPDLLETLSRFQGLELEDVTLEAEELELHIQPTAVSVPTTPSTLAPPEKAKPTEIIKAKFTAPVKDYPGQVLEVKLGATRSEGGTRSKTVVIGGATSPAFYTFERSNPNLPAISLDVFDTPEVPLPKAIKMHIKEVRDDPAEWAKLAVDKFGADMVTVHLMSTDPLIEDASPSKAAKTIEEVLQTVDVPLIVGGCGDPQKDAAVFKKVAEVTEGERVLLSSVTLDMAEVGVLEGVTKAAKEYGHVVLAFTALDLNMARELNRKLYDFLPKDRIIMDLTTAALGYGLEYTFSIMERARMAALMGDPELQHPLLSGTTNTWAAREAWLKMGPKWEPRELRGPLWETVTALSLLLAGVDLFLMMHPAAVRTLREVVDQF
ncbi:CO dehydrogenase/acetyl-CoA synthase subunit delta, partial [Candidatus Bathyarchaeota archaeon]|nr:CO dehydrogenase/acetyl-CoA synthase subunit delta [Candidatus Bathyarchaeota archaeon]